MRWSNPEADSRVFWKEWQDSQEVDVKTGRNLQLLARLIKEVEKLSLKQLLPHKWREREQKKQYICWLFCETFPLVYDRLHSRFKNRFAFAKGMGISLLEVDAIRKSRTVEYETVLTVLPRAQHFYRKAVWDDLGNYWS